MRPRPKLWRGWAAKRGGAFTAIASRAKGQPAFMCPFAQLGHGYGLVLYDMVEHFIVFSLAMAAHDLTPGTWTAAECFGCMAVLNVLVLGVRLLELPRWNYSWNPRRPPWNYSWIDCWRHSSWSYLREP